MKKIYYPNLPSDSAPPYRFREPEGEFEGSVSNPWELVERFEPMDILNGATELVDAQGRIYRISTEDRRTLEENEYKDKTALVLSEIK